MKLSITQGIVCFERRFVVVVKRLRKRLENLCGAKARRVFKR